MRGKWPEEYMHNPNIHLQKSIENIWDDIDNYSFEERYQETKHLHAAINFVVPIPPVRYKGHFMKGVFYTQATDLLLDKFPELREMFNVCANSMFSSYPWAKNADYFFTCYKNEKREQYYKSKHPKNKDVICLPLQDADFLNEYYIAPIPNTPKTIDVLCISTPYPVKNIPIIAKALKIYEEKYHIRLKVVYAIGQRTVKKFEDGSIDYSNLIDYGKNELKKVDEILGDTKKYIQFEPFIEYRDLPKFYSAAKCCVLGSLIEGKNRFISESLSCDVPIITFKDFNKYSRGDFPVFFGNSGEYAPEFSPESLADTIHKVLTNPQNYEPRKNYLKHYGRKNFVNILVDSNPYYEKHLPDYEKGRFFDNIWFNLACWDNYQISFNDLLYDKRCSLMHVVGLNGVIGLIKYYYQKFGYGWKYENKNPFE